MLIMFSLAKLFFKFLICVAIIYCIYYLYTEYIEEYIKYVVEKVAPTPKPASNFTNKKFTKEFLKKAEKIHKGNLKYNVRKTEIYNMARKRALETGKKLMVIGDPMNGSVLNRTYNYPVYGPPYGYGDLCIDLSGCPENTGKSIKSKLEDVIDTFDTDSYVIYISQTLEYLDTNVLEDTLKHLIRVSNGDLFIVHMNYDNDTYKDRNRTFTSNTTFYKVPPHDKIIKYSFNKDKNKTYTIYLNDCNPKYMNSIIIYSNAK